MKKFIVMDKYDHIHCRTNKRQVAVDYVIDQIVVQVEDNCGAPRLSVYKLVLDTGEE
jgi:hypothetical protein